MAGGRGGAGVDRFLCVCVCVPTCLIALLFRLISLSEQRHLDAEKAMLESARERSQRVAANALSIALKLGLAKAVIERKKQQLQARLDALGSEHAQMRERALTSEKHEEEADGEMAEMAERMAELKERIGVS